MDQILSIMFTHMEYIDRNLAADIRRNRAETESCVMQFSLNSPPTNHIGLGLDCVGRTEAIFK